MRGSSRFSCRAFYWTSNLRCSVPLKFAHWRGQMGSRVRKRILPLLLPPLTVHARLFRAPPRARNSPVAPPVSARKSWSCPCSWAGAPLRPRTASTAPVHRPSAYLSSRRDPSHLQLSAVMEAMRLRWSRLESRRRPMSPCPVFIRSSRWWVLGG